jgi:hypothetical protein
MWAWSNGAVSSRGCTDRVEIRTVKKNGASLAGGRSFSGRRLAGESGSSRHHSHTADFDTMLYGGFRTATNNSNAINYDAYKAAPEPTRNSSQA